MTDKKETKKQDSKFTKQQVLNSNKYRHRVDLIEILLKENIKYTLVEVDKLINDFMKGSVK